LNSVSRSYEKLERLRARVKNLRQSDGAKAALAHFHEVDRLIEELETYQTELLQANEELRESELRIERLKNKYFDLYDLAPVGYLTLRRNGQITEANIAAATLLGTERGRLTNVLFSSYVHSDSLATFSRQFNEVAAAGESSSCEVRIRVPGDERRYVKLNCLPEPASIKDTGNIWITLTDIGEMKRLQWEQRKLHRALQKHSRQLEGANRELEAFADSVSHDLRAPIRSIGGFTEALIEEAWHSLSGRARDYVTRIQKSGEHMGRIVDGLLALSRISRAELRGNPVDLAAQARDVIRELKERDPRRKIAFVIPDSLPVSGDGRMLRIALDNLFANAWKFTRNRESARIELAEVQLNGDRVIFIRDNGAGFDSRLTDRLFKPFQRLHADKEFEGIGVGLAIVQRIVERHGGRIWVEGEKGKGVTVYFSLPEDIEV
jgi:signal transduction histidine kinase